MCFVVVIVAYIAHCTLPRLMARVFLLSISFHVIGVCLCLRWQRSVDVAAKSLTRKRIHFSMHDFA